MVKLPYEKGITTITFGTYYPNLSLNKYLNLGRLIMTVKLNETNYLLKAGTLKEKLKSYKGNVYKDFYENCLEFLYGDVVNSKTSSSQKKYEDRTEFLQQIIEGFDNNYKALKAFEMLGILEYLESTQFKDEKFSLIDNSEGYELIKAIVDKKLRKEVQESCVYVNETLKYKDETFKNEKKYYELLYNKNKIMNVVQFLDPTKQSQFKSSDSNYVLGSTLMSNVLAKKPKVFDSVLKFLQMNVNKMLSALKDLRGDKFNSYESNSYIKDNELKNNAKNYVKSESQGKVDAKFFANFYEDLI
ncbi:MAG: hypothetical protein JWM09_1231 [Francisellaceae bacterium]|nr:hypothetical protein [Francisellaceae bacterium]